ncbi:TPA: hypothetical protein ACG8YT_001724 [Enterococcus faecium]
MVKIAGLSKGGKTVSQLYKQNYRDWRQFRKNIKDSYFILPTELENIYRITKLLIYICITVLRQRMKAGIPGIRSIP